MNRFTSWLWPDRTIGKRESRQLREEHNALVNASAELVAACQAVLKGDAFDERYRDLCAAAISNYGSQTPTITPHPTDQHAP